MNYFPSPPNSPYLESFSINQQQINHVICGACNKSLGADWYCSDCHQKCITCNRFLGQDEYCTRCWSFDPVSQQFSRKLNCFYQSTSSFAGLPSPSNSTGSNASNTSNSSGNSSNNAGGPKLLTRPFTWKH
ncbi:unnamed protein product [Mucor hiemalis]